MVENSEAVFGFGSSAFLRFFFAPSTTGSTGKTCVTYGPKRPLLAMIGKLVAGSIPKSRSPDGAASNSMAFAKVNSSGASDSGTLANFRVSPSPSCK